jgi:hypothetical protein
VKVQGRWIADAITMHWEGIKYVNPTDEARINELSDKSFFPTTKSTYMGGSMPGKAFKQANYERSLGQYGQEIRAFLPTWKDFDVVKN